MADDWTSCEHRVERFLLLCRDNAYQIGGQGSLFVHLNLFVTVYCKLFYRCYTPQRNVTVFQNHYKTPCTLSFWQLIA